MSDTPPLPTGKIPEHQTAAYRAARMAVIILSILIILALIALVVGGITRKSRPSPAAAATLALPKGARIVAMESQPGRLILRVRDGDAEEIDILDTGDGHLVSQIKTAARP